MFERMKFILPMRRYDLPFADMGTNVL